MKLDIYTMLTAMAEAEKQKALMTLRGFEDNFAAIGDHTTEDLYDNLDEALTNLVEACDKLDMLTALKDNKL